MIIALDKLNNQGLRQTLVVVPERSIGSSFADEPLRQSGFYWDWQVAPQWNLCNAPGVEIIATYKLHNLNRIKLGDLFHRLFAAAQIDLTIEDRFGRFCPVSMGGDNRR